MATFTTFDDVVMSFHSHPLCKKVLPDGLEKQFFDSALAYYELEIESLDFDDEELQFSTKLSRQVIYSLGLLMYVEYLTRELSRIEKLNGFKGKDITLTGSDTSKRVTMSDLKLEIERCQELMHKQKVHGYN